VAAFLSAILLFAAPFEAFDNPLDALRWYVGAANKPKGGRLKLAKGAWIAARGIEDADIQRLEIRFRHRGGDLEIAFCGKGEPVTRPPGKPIVIRRKKGANKKGDRVFVLSPIGVRVDGEPIEWTGRPTGSFRLRALGGAVEIDEIELAPRPTPPPAPSRLERETLFYLSIPPSYHDGEHTYRRVTLTLWDAEVAFLFRRTKTAGATDPLRFHAKGSPLLGHLVAVSDGGAWATKAATHELAMADWRDERGNLSSAQFRRYLCEEYARFELLMAAQRVMLDALVAKRRKACKPLIALAAIRHSANSRAALALAETLGFKKAVELVRRELGRDARGDAGARRVSSDRVRGAAAKAARALLKEIPREWPGFTFDPSSRGVTLQQAAEILR